MPKVTEIQKMMEDQNTSYIRIYDMNGNRIFVIEENNVAAAISKMDTLMPFISSYGKIVIEAATQGIKNQNYKQAFKWNCEFDKATTVGTTGHTNMWKIPDGFVSNDVMLAKLETIQKEIALNRQIDDLQRQMKEKDKDDPTKMFEKLAGPILYMMGKPVEEIQKLGSLYSTGIAGPPAAAAGTAKTHTLTMKDVEGGTLQDKQKKLDELLVEMSKYASVEQMIIIFDAFVKKCRENPETPIKIMNFLPMI